VTFRYSLFSNLRITANGELQSGVQSGGPGFGGGTATMEWETTIDTNVRTLEYANSEIFYITNDNQLWGYGTNHDGRLGDGTGVARTEPVLIMEDVAVIYTYTFSNTIYAIKTDRTLWTWGNGNFAPVHIADDVVRVYPARNVVDAYYQTSGGGIYRISRQGEDEREFPEAAYDFTVEFGDQHTLYFINSERTLIRRTEQREDVLYEEIATGVERLVPINHENLFFTTTDGTLWGMGTNRNGELGDGTRVPRETPVQIAENVAQTWQSAFLKHDGTFWTWNQNNPTPQQLLENVVTTVRGAVGTTGLHALFQDGRVLVNSNMGQGHQFEMEGIRIPQTHTW
jgi:alpha-tubulin suppressor-like RCC1 family protein